MQRVFLPTIILATDVLLNPSAPHADVQKAEVPAVCKMLEKSQQELITAIEEFQRGLLTLISMLQKQQSQPSGSQPKRFAGMKNASFVAPCGMLLTGQPS